MSNKYDAIIIGGGLGGLLTGNILSREGMKVLVIEQNNKLGGSIQSFAKKKTIFNTGLNYTESLGDGEVLNKYFKYFKIMDKLKIKQLDIDCFNKISFGTDDIEYPLAQGHDNFVEKLSVYFPGSENSLRNYIKTIKNTCEAFPLYTFDTSSGISTDERVLQQSAYKYIQSVHPDRKLQQVLAGMNPLYGGVVEKTPLYVHALINYSFINSVWRLVDGSSQIAARIADGIKSNGGEIMLSSKVVSIGGKNKQVQYIKLENGESIFADKIISNMHPASTLKLVPPELSKKVYQKRITSLENTIGMFTIYIVLKKNSFSYYNHNFHHFTKENVWTTNYKESNWPEHYFLYTPAISKSDKWADGLIAMTYMNYNEVKKWENTYIENRGEEYLDFKRKKAEKLIDSIEKKFPNIRQSIDSYYTSTPLTYRDYTGTVDGSSYGILKDYNDPFSTIITPRSRIKNLYFTGQNLNMHGILGVTISAVLTSAEIIGFDYLLKKIHKE
ncbi:MAG: FAD-dependent oxidoreductase [Bacteroidota bacterium]